MYMYIYADIYIYMYVCFLKASQYIYVYLHIYRGVYVITCLLCIHVYIPRGFKVVLFGYDPYFRLRDYNILPKKEPHWSPWVERETLK